MNASSELRHWYRQFSRDLPWRNTNDPYPIWLSEIILQQTRVNQGLPYFERFISSYPNVRDLAEAPLDDVLKLWEGLGYYSRARNLHKGAKYISENGFPKNFEGWLKVPGVGPYTAAAVSSFALGENVPVVDGNVNRVIARLMDVETPVNSTEGQNIIRSFAEELIQNAPPAEHNQAMMELGALICKPKNPSCDDCPWMERCLARKNNNIDVRPIKLKKTAVKAVKLHYTAIFGERGLYIQKRPSKGIWAELYELSPNKAELHQLPDSSLHSDVYEITHLLSHRKLSITIQKLELHGDMPAKIGSLKLHSWRETSNLAFPRPLRAWLDENLLPLQGENEG